MSSPSQINGQSIAYWNADPWFLPVLNHSPSKPAGWVLTNPLATGTLPSQLDAGLYTSGIAYAHDAKGGTVPYTGNQGTDNNPLYPPLLLHSWYTNNKQPGTVISPDDPAYWVVKLDQTNLDALAKFDVLILDGHDTMTLTNGDRNNLQYLLEHGATIWLNNSQRMGASYNNFYPQIGFSPPGSNAGYIDHSLVHLFKADPTNWLLNAYYQLTDQEVDCLHDCMSAYDYLTAGVAGYGNTTGSQVHSVVNLELLDGNGNVVSNNPAIAAGHFGNGLVVASAVDLIGATSDWWEVWHQYQLNNNSTPWSLDVWPYARSMVDPPGSNDADQPNYHDRYVACTKFIFNLFDKQSSWNMAGGNAGATRAVATPLPVPLARGWTANFTALGDPVAQDNYLAETGYSTLYQTIDPTLASELRVYRIRRVTDDGGTVMDYPYGLYTVNNYYLNPSLMPSPSWWSSYFPLDAEHSGGMDLCFSAPNPPDPTVHWVGSPIFGKITLPLTWQANYIHSVGELIEPLTPSGFSYQCIAAGGNGIGASGASEPNWPITPGNTVMDGSLTWKCIAFVQPYSATVLYALRRIGASPPYYYKPCCYVLDPYNYESSYAWPDIGPFPGQVGYDLWANQPMLDGSVDGFARTSMTLAHNHLVITTLGEATGSAPRIFLLDATTGQPGVSLGPSTDWPANFRLTGPATEVAAQIDYQASALEAGPNDGSLTSANFNQNAQDLRRDIVNVLAVTGEYFSTASTTRTTRADRRRFFSSRPRWW